MKNSVKKKQTLIKFSIIPFIKTPPNFEPCNTRLLINAKKEKNKQINAKLTFMLEFYARNKGSSI